MKPKPQQWLVIALLGFGPWVSGQDQSDSTATGNIKKGKTLISSIFNFSVTNTTNTRVTGVNTETKQSTLGGYVGGGRMFTDHWGALLDIGAVSTTTANPTLSGGVLNNLSVHKHDYSLVPIVRYYWSIDEDTYFLVQAQAAVSTGTLETNELTVNNTVAHYSFKTYGYSAGISPGFSYFINSKLSSEIAVGLIGYSQYHGSDGLGNTIHVTSSQSLIYLNSVSLGFVLYL